MLTTSPALASAIYPDKLKSGLGLGALPECTSCHATSRGGPNTAKKPFALTLRRLGLEGGANVDSLEAAIRSAEGQASDSDSDGATDVTELLAGTSPNDVDTPAPEGEVPRGTWFPASAKEQEPAAGCGMAMQGGQERAPTGLFVAFAVACCCLRIARAAPNGRGPQE